MITPQEAVIYGNIRYQRAAWLIPLFVHMVCLNRKQVSEFTGISLNTAKMYLDDLAALGIVIRQGYHDGYVLTSNGKQLVAMPLLEQPGQDVSVLEGDTVEVEQTNLQNEPTPTGELCPNSKDQIDLSLVVVVTNTTTSSDNITTTTSFQKKSKTPLDLLQAIPKHFDFSVNPGCILDGTTCEQVLGWLAMVSHTRTFRAPGGFVYNKIRDNKYPDSRYLENYLSILPESYLVEVGLLEPLAAVQGDEEFEQDEEPGPKTPNQIWRDVICDDRLPQVHGLPFTGMERIEPKGDNLIVAIRGIGRNSGCERSKLANEQIASIASLVYAELTGNPSARVELPLQQFNPLVLQAESYPAQNVKRFLLVLHSRKLAGWRS
jgi:hypothetical protein